MSAKIFYLESYRKAGAYNLCVFLLLYNHNHYNSVQFNLRKEADLFTMWDEYFNTNSISEIRLKTTVYFGPGAIAKINDIVKVLKSRGVNHVLCMTGGRSYKLTGAWDYVEKACKDNGVGITLYDKITPNPTTTAIDSAVELAKHDGAKAVIGIGGGSPIDAGKSAAILLAYPDKTTEDLYTFKFTPDHAVPNDSNQSHSRNRYRSRQVRSCYDSSFKLQARNCVRLHLP